MQYTRYYRVIGGARILRAIKFVASYYTVGLPPTLLDIPVLTRLDSKQVDMILDAYPILIKDLKRDLGYYSRDIVKEYVPRDVVEEIDKCVRTVVDKLSLNPRVVDEKYYFYAKKIADLMKSGSSGKMVDYMACMAKIRGFPG